MVKRDKAFEILGRSGINKRNYLPPIYCVIWRIGILLPPPHFSGFMVNLFISGAPLGLMCVGFYMMVHDYSSASALEMVAVGALVTGVWGGLIAFYYFFSRKLHGLPSWNSLA